MRILCCLDGTNNEQIRDAVKNMLRAEERTLAVLYVTDIGPEMQIEHQRIRFLRPPRPPQPRREQMRKAVEMTAHEILEEGSRSLDGAEKIERTGRPEREIVRVAQEWQADIVVLCSRGSLETASPPGPKSVGHVARFVLDHAPCPVLLLRPRSDAVSQLPPR
ncbi:nucleotide-binding universal stress UspA family protein [Thermosporothrix hazakensis]|jgi:nucleotide-binding universal stress UspA family protein|uniref:Nucleotide-binding universal stress UspA family protein n=1 Tax=Thermosporothrix hazakensis TaxID=644383 RepID=A0A326U0Q1_THEHA|nr:universal stress protein [Thermosporothrix hazakensis]PZW24018.1 nucleotide-binding universal stress UspA family protein [Thermosporothrix hazakensis]GCE50234.1 hypothetical protein KTH_51030 [Thermosporothrix hazakensis]